jgi:hypothetical protein
MWQVCADGFGVETVPVFREVFCFRLWSVGVLPSSVGDFICLVPVLMFLFRVGWELLVSDPGWVGVARAVGALVCGFEVWS